MKIWKPDTCKCIVEELYNGNEIIGGGQIINKCEAHTTVPDTDLYGVLYANPDGENKVKNTVRNILLGQDKIKNLGLEKTVSNKGSSEIAFNDGVDYEWNFIGTGKDRKLNVEIKGASLTVNQKESIKSLCNSKFGLGKVEII